MSAAAGAAAPLLRLALLGVPNCGKTALFNALTGSRQKVANYAGVTVERKEGWLLTPGGRRVLVVDLPGAYSLHPLSEDEALTRDVVTGARADEPVPDVLVCVADATRLSLDLRLVLEARQLGVPMVLVLNMMDVARRQGLQIDVQRLSQELGLPVVPAVAVTPGGVADVVALLERWPEPAAAAQRRSSPLQTASALPPALRAQAAELYAEVQRVLAAAVRTQPTTSRWEEALDRVLLHPLWGMVVLVAVLFVVFQAVFAWAAPLQEGIEAAVAAVGQWLAERMAEGPLRSLLLDGVLAGVGGVLVFLPQVLLLFAFILALEDSGYLPRAAFLLDRLMAGVGLSGRSFIPLLSSFACAVPGILATRTIPHWRERWLTMLLAPLMTCSARLPVYALLIGAFVPDRTLAGGVGLQGLVLLGLYMAGVVGALLLALGVRLWRRWRSRGPLEPTPLLMELPAYRWPNGRALLRALAERAWLFLRRVGSVILALTVLLWALASYPQPPEGAVEPAVAYSAAGQLGRWLQPLFAPLGFDWPIVVALIAAMAAREVAVGALATVYAVQAADEAGVQLLGQTLAAAWPLPTALALLAWFVFAPQCVATLAAIGREGRSWRTAAGVAALLFAVAYAAAWLTHALASWWVGA